jgi:hypothetical protein
MMPKGMLRNTPIIVVRERMTPVRNKLPVTLSTYIEKTGDVIPWPKVYMKNANEIGRITLLKLAICHKSVNSLNIPFYDYLGI